MDKFIAKPNLPEGKVSLCVIDMRAKKEVIENIKKYGADVILSGRCRELYDSVSCHPDMYMHHLGGKYIVAAPNAPDDTMRELANRGFNIIRGEKAAAGKYPDNVAYNVARIGDWAVCNIKHTDRILLNYFHDMNIKLIDVKQGYAKCSICIVNAGALITSDEGIYRVLLKYGFDILKIRPGHIELPGLNYGFIGGASGLLDAGTMFFAGNLLTHPDYNNIEIFLKKYNINTKPLSNEVLFDVGSIIPLKEYSI